MRQGFTVQFVRGLFIGLSAICSLLLLLLTLFSHQTFAQRENRAALTLQVQRGKRVWEEHDCAGCHTILGEGAYFAPELGNVYSRRGADFIRGWMLSMPSNRPGRRQMPYYPLSPTDLDALLAFLKWTSEINTSNWPPTIEG